MSLNAPVSAHSRAVIRHPLTLATHIGLKTYNRTFGRVEAGLFLADVVAHLQGRASDAYAAEIAQVHAALARELDRLAALVTAQARWVAHVRRRHAPPGADADADADAIDYTQPARVELAMRTPKVRRYAELLVQLEETLRALDAAWYAGAIDTPAQLQAGNRLFRQFHRGCGVIERLARGLARRVRDDSEAPGYRDMLIKRTGRGPERDEPPAPVVDEGAEAMTLGEAASLQATEALVADLSTAPVEPALTTGPETSALVADSPALTTGPETSALVADSPALTTGPATSALVADSPALTTGPATSALVADSPALATGPEVGAPAAEWAWNAPAGGEVAGDELPGATRFAPGETAHEASPAEPLAVDGAGTRPRRLRDVLGGARATA